MSDDLRTRDEVLQIMYWMLGEGIAHEADAAYLAKFLQLRDVAPLSGALRTLHAQGLVLRGGAAGTYRLSQDGLREGARRFHDEFQDLTKVAHGQCAPGCWCHTPEGEGKECPSGRQAATV